MTKNNHETFDVCSTLENHDSHLGFLQHTSAILNQYQCNWEQFTQFSQKLYYNEARDVSHRFAGTVVYKRHRGFAACLRWWVGAEPMDVSSFPAAREAARQLGDGFPYILDPPGASHHIHIPAQSTEQAILSALSSESISTRDTSESGALQLGLPRLFLPLFLPVLVLLPDPSSPCLSLPPPGHPSDPPHAPTHPIPCNVAMTMIIMYSLPLEAWSVNVKINMRPMTPGNWTASDPKPHPSSNSSQQLIPFLRVLQF